MKRLILAFSVVLCAVLGLGACNKPNLYGTIQEADSVVRNYQVAPTEAFRAAKEALVFRGYSIKTIDAQNMTIETYWQPSTSDSHYVLVFGKPDYGTVGAYYRLVIKVKPRSDGSQVIITNVAKSFISNVKSSEVAESSLFEKISDFTRRQDIQVTNIGLQ